MLVDVPLCLRLLLINGGVGSMRVIIVGRSAFANGYERTLARLIAILDVIMKNPSNPNFDQYLFESISALMR